MAPLLLLASPIDALADDSPAGEQFGCDTPGGHYSQYRRPVGAGPIKLDSVIGLNTLRSGTEWLPLVNVMLNAGAVERRLGVRIIANSQKKTAVAIAVFPGAKANEGVIMGEVGLKTAVQISISISDLKSRVSVNGVAREGPPLPDANWGLDLSCSSVDSNINVMSLEHGE